MKRALITGITGQDGSYLAELLLAKDYRVYGLTRRSSTPNTLRIQPLLNQVTLISADLLDSTSLLNAVEEAQPDEIYNLAAQSVVHSSWDQPILTAEFTGVSVARLLAAVRRAAPKARFYQASSSEIIGKAITVPQNESTPFHPRSPYGIAKLFGHWTTVNYRESFGMHATSGILFNHESPRRSVEFVTRKITRHVALIKNGLATELRLGNLEARRDWGFAGDYVEAMWRMVQLDEPRDLVIATGEAHSVREFAERAFARADLDYREFVRVDEKFYRPAEVDVLVGDSTLARKLLGWEPKVGFAELVDLMVDADLQTVQKEMGTQGPSILAPIRLRSILDFAAHDLSETDNLSKA